MSNQNEKVQRRRRRPPVPIQIIQEGLTIAMAQILVNMTDAKLQRDSMNILKIDDVMDSDTKIMAALQEIENKQSEKSNQAKKKKRESKEGVKEHQ